jgi:hypothetical protein
MESELKESIKNLGWLKYFLFCEFIYNLLLAVYLIWSTIAGVKSFDEVFHSHLLLVFFLSITILVFFATSNLFALAAILKLKKWGVYLYLTNLCLIFLFDSFPKFPINLMFVINLFNLGFFIYVRPRFLALMGNIKNTV